MNTSNKCLIIVGLMLLVLLVMIEKSHADGTGHVYKNGTPESDCAVHDFELDNTSIGFKLGTFLVGVGPEIGWGTQSGINWHPNTQNLIARYKQLCTDYNSGIIDKDEYKERLSEIEKLQVDYSTDQYKQQQKLFDELDELAEERFGDK